MAEEFSKSLLKVSLAQMAQNVGFHSVTTTSFDVLLDLLRRFIQTLCEDARIYSDHFGRSEPIIDDIGLVFTQMGFSLNELADYFNQTVPVHFIRKVSEFPVRRPDKLNIPKSDASELKDRADYIPRYLPLTKPAKVEELSATNEEAIKIAAGRISTRRSTLQQKSDQLNSDDWLSDLYDFDAIKSGLVKLVQIQLPPPRPPTPEPPVALPPPFYEENVRSLSPLSKLSPVQCSELVEPVSNERTSPFSVLEFQKASKSFKSTTATRSVEKSANLKPSTVLKDLNTSTTSLSDTSIEDCITSVVEQTRQFKVSEQQPIVLPKQSPASTDVCAIEDVPAPSPPLPPASVGFRNAYQQQQPNVGEVTPTKPRKSIYSSKTTVSALLAAKAARQEAAKAARQESTAASAIRCVEQSLPPVLMSEKALSCNVPPLTILSLPLTTNDFAVSGNEDSGGVSGNYKGSVNDDQVTNVLLKETLKFNRQIFNKDLIKKRLKKKAQENEAKRCKIDNICNNMIPLAKRPPPPMPVVDTSTLFQPDPVTKKVAPLILPKPKSTPTPAPVVVDAQRQQHVDAGADRKLVGSLKLKLQIPSATPTVSVNAIASSKSPNKASNDSKIQTKKDAKEKERSSKEKRNLKERPAAQHHDEAASSKRRNVDELSKKLMAKKMTNPVDVCDARTTASSESTSLPMKVPKLILKISSKAAAAADQGKTIEEPKRPSSASKSRPVFTISPNSSSPDANNSVDRWSNEAENKHLASPPPKSPSMHSKSPSLHSFSCANANSPPPKTPSPRSLSPNSPSSIGIFIPEADDEAEDFQKTVESQEKFVSPANSQVSGSSKRIQESPFEAPEEEKVWYCPVCHVPYEEGADMIACDKCDNWFHWCCVGLKQAPPDDEQWYCSMCISKKQSKPTKIVKKKTKKR